jgi:pSer/pThr/pTyr-binding forkhead associated (FHA) protein
MPTLTWQETNQTQSLALEAGSVVRIGRAGAIEISLHDPLVSRLHAEVRLERGRWTIVDLGSRNGTSRNGARVGSGRTLSHGDLIRCGSTIIAFEDADEESLPGSQPVTLDAPEPPSLNSGERALLELLVVRPSETTDQLADALHLTDAGVRQRLKRLYRKFEIGGSDSGKRSRLVEAARLHDLIE